MTKRFAAEALKEYFEVDAWNFCFHCRKTLLFPNIPKNNCVVCNVSFHDSQVKWKNFAVEQLKKEDDAVAEKEAKHAAKGAVVWPKNASTAGVPKTVYDAFQAIWDDKDGLSDWDEDKYGSIVDAMQQFEGTYKKLADKHDKGRALDYIRNGANVDEMYEGFKEIMEIFATWKNGDAIPASA